MTKFPGETWLPVGVWGRSTWAGHEAPANCRPRRDHLVTDGTPSNSTTVFRGQNEIPPKTQSKGLFVLHSVEACNSVCQKSSKIIQNPNMKTIVFWNNWFLRVQTRLVEFKLELWWKPARVTTLSIRAGLFRVRWNVCIIITMHTSGNILVFQGGDMV